MYLSYYTMHSLATCAKVLYDNDILDKQNELDKYKKDMLEPVIIFSSQEEFYNKKSDMLVHLEDAITLWHKINFLEYTKVLFLIPLKINYVFFQI